MDLHIFQRGFNFSQDGPGNRLVYHLQGCNLHCPWCSNPEGMTFCGGTVCSVEDIVAEVLRSRPMFFDGGGVTLTGGEAAMQPQAVKELLSALSGHGIHTALESNGTAPLLSTLYPYLSLLLLDCKHYDPAALRQVTGGALSLWSANLRAALDAGVPVAVRIPVIPGFNDGLQHAQGFAALFARFPFPPGTTFELLPYHTYGKRKWERLGLTYAMPEDARVEPAVIRDMEACLAAHGCIIVHT